jgi:hypothetical protein
MMNAQDLEQIIGLQAFHKSLKNELLFLKGTLRCYVALASIF